MNRQNISYRSGKRALTEYSDKYFALMHQGYIESEASRMATNIPVIYG